MSLSKMLSLCDHSYGNYKFNLIDIWKNAVCVEHYDFFFAWWNQEAWVVGIHKGKN